MGRRYTYQQIAQIYNAAQRLVADRRLREFEKEQTFRNVVIQVLGAAGIVLGGPAGALGAEVAMGLSLSSFVHGLQASPAPPLTQRLPLTLRGATPAQLILFRPVAEAAAQRILDADDSVDWTTAERPILIDINGSPVAETRVLIGADGTHYFEADVPIDQKDEHDDPSPERDDQLGTHGSFMPLTLPWDLPVSLHAQECTFGALNLGEEPEEPYREDSPPHDSNSVLSTESGSGSILDGGDFAEFEKLKTDPDEPPLIEDGANSLVSPSGSAGAYESSFGPMRTAPDEPELSVDEETPSHVELRSENHDDNSGSHHDQDLHH